LILYYHNKAAIARQAGGFGFGVDSLYFIANISFLKNRI